MRILEESAQTDNTGKIVNGMNGLNLADMTFHEVNSWKEQEIVKQLHIASDSIGLKPNCSIASYSIELEPHCSTGDKEDQPTAGWVGRCWCLSPTCRPPPPAWLQGCQLDQQRLLSEKNINITLINTNIGTNNNHLLQLGYKVNNQLIEKD